MASQVRTDERVPEVEDEKLLDFIAGFPCTRFHCRGRLTHGEHSGAPAVVCSVCEHVYYVLRRS